MVDICRIMASILCAVVWSIEDNKYNCSSSTPMCILWWLIICEMNVAFKIHMQYLWGYITLGLAFNFQYSSSKSKVFEGCFLKGIDQIILTNEVLRNFLIIWKVNLILIRSFYQQWWSITVINLCCLKNCPILWWILLYSPLT